LGLRFVDVEPTALLIGPVNLLDGQIGLTVLLHLDETETTAPPGLAIDQNLGRLDDPVALEKLLKIFGSRAVGEISHIEPFRHRANPVAARDLGTLGRGTSRNQSSRPGPDYGS
jgi:hypothetical protein